MSRRLARAALTLYPLAHRRRYEPEMRALLEDAPPRPADVLGLVAGAARAHLRPPKAAATTVDQADRMRASASGQLACWVVFAAAGFGFYKTTEDFNAAGYMHPLLGDSFSTVQWLAFIASIAVLLAALPLVLAALAEARRRPSLRVLVSLPIVAVAVFAALTAVLIVLAHTSPHHPTDFGRGALLAWELAALVVGAVCVLAARRALFETPVRRRWLVGALAGGTVVTVAMTLITIAVIVYAVALAASAPGLAAESNGPLQLTSVGVSLVEQAVVMAIAAALAVTTTVRGWRAYA
jgi:hypothetical protein